VSKRVALDAHIKTINQMFKLDLVWHTKLNSGNKLKKVQKGAEGFEKVIRTWFNVIIEVFVNIIGIGIILFSFDKLIGTLMLIFMVSYFFLSRWYIKKASQASHVVNIAEEDFTGIMFESINNIRSVKIMSMATILISKLNTEVKKLYDKMCVMIFWFQSASAAKNAAGQFARLGILLVIVFGVLNGQYEIGFLVLFYAYFDRIWQSISELAEVSQEFSVSKFSVARMMEVLNERVIIDIETNKQNINDDWKKIEVKNLSFSYENEGTLKDVTFTIKRGEKIGIVGLSGAGKSTLFKLLLKEYEDFDGEILIDGVSIKDISKTNYFEHASVVLQETEVFDFTIHDNITISKYKDRNNTKLFENVLKIAHLDKLVESLPNKQDTFIGEKGIKLSGGEKQRLGIARAVFKQPQILFLDEATSHLDLESEEIIQDALHTFFEGVTAVVIAHRLTTIKEMDKIIVLEGGIVVEEGSFVELQKKKGRFYDLWEKQKL
jgi:ABC-type multidrug transport system fused ATPase/permease subunit